MSLRLPKYCHHKASGRAYVKIHGKRTYLGAWNTPESREEYEKLVDRLRRLHEPTGKYHTTVSRLCVEFLKYAQGHYRDSDGNPTKEVDNYRTPIRLLVSLFGKDRCAEFGPRKLLALRDEFGKKHVRTIANRQLFRVRRIFKWGVSRELLPADVLVGLQAVEGLQAGRSHAKESEPVLPAPQGDIDAALQFMTSPVAAMVRLQLVTGARPSEIRLMVWGELDTTGDVWIYQPKRHKNAWRKKTRAIFIGPKGQDILLDYLARRQPGEYLFRPIDGREEYVAKRCREGSRATVRGGKDANSPYSLTGYISSIRKACERAKVPVWSPGQLRHNAATNINRQFGDIDASRVVLGHSEKTTTERYAERDLARAMDIAREMG